MLARIRSVVVVSDAAAGAAPHRHRLSAAAAAVVSAAFVVSVVEELLPQAVSVVAAIAPAMVNAITFLSFIMFPSVFCFKNIYPVLCPIPIRQKTSHPVFRGKLHDF